MYNTFLQARSYEVTATACTARSYEVTATACTARSYEVTATALYSTFLLGNHHTAN